MRIDGWIDIKLNVLAFPYFTSDNYGLQVKAIKNNISNLIRIFHLSYQTKSIKLKKQINKTCVMNIENMKVVTNTKLSQALHYIGFSGMNYSS